MSSTHVFLWVFCVLVCTSLRCTQVLRVWKGYRSAQLGWILTQDTVAHSEGASQLSIGVGLYLVILAPSRERVEVWRARLGPRVLVVPLPNAGKQARLVTTCTAGVVAGADQPLSSR